MPILWPRRAFRLPWRAPSEIEADLDEELEFHLEERIAEFTARGMTPAAAREEALRRFGNLEEARSYCRRVAEGRARLERRRDWLAGWSQDLRFALRQLLRTPGFTLIAILTIGLGVGANTAIFSAVHRLLLDPLPYPDGDRIVVLLETSEKSGTLVTPAQEVIAGWRAQSRTLDGIEVFDERSVTLGGTGDPERLVAGRMTSTLPGFLRVTLPLGRGFSAEETVEHGPRVAVIGYGLWQGRFAGRSDVLGQTLEIEGEPYTIIGVAPRDFTLPFMSGGPARQLWLPLPPPRDDQRVQAIARLRPGVAAKDASAELSRIEKAHWAGRGSLIDFTAVAHAPQDFLAGSLREGLLVLFGVVGVVLLIACANVANLLVARAATRSHELGVRAALGAGRGRLIRQLLTESTALALLGGGLGVLLAWRGLALLSLVRPAALNQLDDVRLAPVALAWSLGLTLFTGLLFGLAPALLATNRHLSDLLRSGASTTRRGAKRLRSALVILEVALSVALLIGAGLLIRSLQGMQRVELGFQPEGVSVVTITLPEPESPPARGQADSALDPLLSGLFTRVQAIPGVRGASYAAGVPPTSGIALGQLQIEGKEINPARAPQVIGFNRVNREYFGVMRLPLKSGRLFEREQGIGHVIINESMARRYWPGEDPVGKRYRLGEQGTWMTVVGIVPDLRIPGRRGVFDSLQTYGSLGGASDMYGRVMLVVRTTGDAGAILRQIREEVSATGGGIRVSGIDALPSMLDAVLAQPRFTMLLYSGFATLALVLATIGLYGVVSYAVSQRTREIGVRIALGAGPISVVGLVLRQGLGLTLIGVVLGLAGAAAGTRAMRSMLFEVSPLDPATFGLVAAGLIAVALVAAWVPARRAVRVDPVTALRGE